MWIDPPTALLLLALGSWLTLWLARDGALGVRRGAALPRPQRAPGARAGSVSTPGRGDRGRERPALAARTSWPSLS